MQLSLSEPQERHHDGMVHAVCWNPLNNELLSIGDDKKLCSWRVNAESSFEDGHGTVYSARKVLDLSHHCIAAAWCPSQSFMALAFVDGSVRIASFDKSANLKLTKTMEGAHHGAVTALSWNADGSALISGGEDGVIKQWSRSGNLRSKLIETANAIHSVAWSPSNDSIVYAADKFIGVQSVLSAKKKKKKKSSKEKKWRAHGGIVLCLAWNAMNNLLLSGGEDCYYRIWDEFGRLLYCSKVQNYPVCSVAWAPNGKYFGVGSFNKYLLCDFQGWPKQEMVARNGSALSMAWTRDSTQLGIGCADGTVKFAHIANRTVSSAHWHCRLNARNQITVQNILARDFAEVYETLEFAESVIAFALAFDYLVVATTKQCFVYQIDDAISTTPSQSFALKSKSTIFEILQTPSFFVLVGDGDALHIVGYDARTICEIAKVNAKTALSPHLLNAQNTSAANDCVALISTANSKEIHFFDPYSARAMSDAIEHSTNVTSIALSVAITGTSPRKLAFVDSNKDLWLAKVENGHGHGQQNHGAVKLKTIVDCVAWHCECDILLALSDKQLVIWYYPDIVWCDADLIEASLLRIDCAEIGANAHILCVEGSAVHIRKENGDEEVIAFSPVPLAMYDAIGDGEWEKALRLCSVTESDSESKALWGALTALAVDHGQIEVALQGLTALEESDKILFLREVLAMPLQAQRDAELALFKRNINGAENILLTNNLIYRAIRLNLRLFRWKRALELAIDHRTHIDTVLAIRAQSLGDEKEESIDLFLKYEAEVDVNWSVIEEKCRQERDKEFETAGIARADDGEGDDAFDDDLRFLHKKDPMKKNQNTKRSGRKQLEALLGIETADERPQNQTQSAGFGNPGLLAM